MIRVGAGPTTAADHRFRGSGFIDDERRRAGPRVPDPLRSGSALRGRHRTRDAQHAVRFMDPGCDQFKELPDD